MTTQRPDAIDGTDAADHDAPTLAAALAALKAAAGEPPYQGITKEVARGPQPVRVAASTISDWTRGKTLPRDQMALDAVLDYLQSLATSRDGKRRAAELRSACEQAYFAAKTIGSDTLSHADASIDYFTLIESMRSVVPMMKWSGLSALSGIVGNAAYDLLKAAVLRRRKATPTTLADALLLAETAIRVRCHELGLNQPPPETFSHEEYQAGDGRWVMTFHDQSGTSLKFFVRIPPGRPNDEDVSLDVFVPDMPLPRSIDGKIRTLLMMETLPNDEAQTGGAGSAG